MPRPSFGIETGQVESNSTADYAKNIQSMVDANCNMIVTAGFLLSDDTLAAAKKNPDVEFAIVDNNDRRPTRLSPTLPLLFNTAQSSFLAGYLAAGMTKTRSSAPSAASAPNRHNLHGRLQPGTTTTSRRAPMCRFSAGMQPSRTDRSPVTSMTSKAGSVRRRADQPGRWTSSSRSPAQQVGALQAAKAVGARSSRLWTPTVASALRPTAPTSSPVSTRSWMWRAGHDQGREGRLILQ